MRFRAFVYSPGFAASLLVLAMVVFYAAPMAATKKPPLRPVNLNTANALELQQVPGIGPATADKILKMRKSYGPFKSVDDLRAIKGIGPKRLEKMRKYLTVGKTASPAQLANKTSARPTSKSPPGVGPKTPVQKSPVDPSPSVDQEKEPP